MRFATLVVLIAPLMSGIMAGPAAEPDPARVPARRVPGLETRDTGLLLDLSKRSCSYNGCTCIGSPYEGVFCANCVASDGEYVVQDLGSGGSIGDGKPILNFSMLRFTELVEELSLRICSSRNCWGLLSVIECNQVQH